MFYGSYIPSAGRNILVALDNAQPNRDKSRCC